MRIRTLAAACSIAVLSSAPALAIPVTYEFAGTSSGLDPIGNYFHDFGVPYFTPLSGQITLESDRSDESDVDGLVAKAVNRLRVELDKASATVTAAASRQFRKVRELRGGAAVRFGPVITFLTSTPVGRARPADDRRIEALIPPRDVLVSGPRTHGTRHESTHRAENRILCVSCPRNGTIPYLSGISPSEYAQRRR